MSDKARAIAILMVAEVAAMSLWFVSAAILPELQREADLTAFAQAALSSAVQAGFVFGALVSAFLGLADRYDPRKVFAICAVLGAAANAVILFVDPGSLLVIGARFATGALLAGVYPVGMKIMVGWGKDDRGLLVGALVGALTLGSAAPHILALGGGPDWRSTVVLTSLGSVAAGCLCLFTKLGPYHAIAARFDPTAIREAWTNRRVRLAYGGYLGHMWELYAMWAWIAAATTVSFSMTVPVEQAENWSRLLTALAITAGGAASVYAGKVADRIGKAEVTIVAMMVSGLAAIATALSFGGPVWITCLAVLIWGISIIPDSAQFSALVADASPPEQAGSLMTFQTALGFALTIVTVQATPSLVDLWGWPPVLAAMALGPLFGIMSMARLRAMGPA